MLISLLGFDFTSEGSVMVLLRFKNPKEQRL